MFHRKLPRILRAACLVAVGFVCASSAFAQPEFFAFDNGVGRGELTPSEQAALLKELGYDGIGYTGTENLTDRLDAFEQAGLRVFNLYVPCYVDRDPPFSDDLKTAIRELKGTEVDLWLTVQGNSDSDETAASVVTEIADLAAESDLRVVLYPHAGFYVADLDDAVRVLKKVDRKNVGATFNLCHELKAGNYERFDAIIENAAPWLSLVSINGADFAGGWDQLIQTLDRGELELLPILKKLKAMGYDGPIGLQCYNVPGDTRENLKRSVHAWKELQKEMDEKHDE